MRIRIAILAACIGTLALAQTEPAQATLVNTTHSNVRHPGVTAKPGAANPASPSIINTSRSNIKYPSISDQAAGGNLPKNKKKN